MLDLDFFDLLLHTGLITGALVCYLVFFKKTPIRKGCYGQQGWNYPLKVFFARYYAIKRWKAGRKSTPQSYLPREIQSDGWDSITLRATAVDGTAILLGIRKICDQRQLAEIIVYIQLPDGSTYRLPRHPDTAVGAWEPTEACWSAGGLKIQVLEPLVRMRILYNGLLTRNSDNTTQHVRFNFIWCAGSGPVRHPEDWSEQLAAQALALVPWRDGNWRDILDRNGNIGWVQWGCVQGRLTSHLSDGSVDRTEYLRARGSIERSWAPHGYTGQRRSVNITVVGTDGTMIHLRAESQDVLTQLYIGSVRFPNYDVEAIVSTDFSLPDFGESASGIPNSYTINVSTNNRTLKLFIRLNRDGGTLLSGVPYQHELHYQTLTASIDGFVARGFLELGYEPKESCEPSVPLSPARHLTWLPLATAGDVTYCLPFESPACACADLVGGKGASLALLSSVQNDEGYKVPPGYCLTTLALEKHLQTYPELKAAILAIEAANENYDEAVFKEKCNRASNLFTSTAVADEVRDEILVQLHELRKKATEQGLGPELRFAVRSSAVGEDGEALSAAGQNETILGCVSDGDVITAVQKCWGSMFAFTSAHYRRQNGQACLCGGGVVIQALVSPRAAGVLFTRHPDAGDPSRMLITANYGLGESVVSGSVEPDTIIVKRVEHELTIAKIELGSKTHRIASSGSGVVTEHVPETDRNVPCLSETEALRLAKICLRQEELWGAPRDIEWAVTKEDMYLLQARPITSLERWSEEELLHEMDSAIMSDLGLITFANIGEVLPKPISPLSKDLMLRTFSDVMQVVITWKREGDKYIEMSGITHCRGFLDSMQTLYYRLPKKIDMSVKMMEMAVHGHTVMDENLFATALHVNPPKLFDKIRMLFFLSKAIYLARWHKDQTLKVIKELNVEKLSSDEPETLLADILESSLKPINKLNMNHLMTSSASSGSQYLAMSILLEGGHDFTPEQCNEIGLMLSSSGEAVSAEVPHALARLAKELSWSGKAEEFQKQDPKLALGWLEENLPDIHKDVTIFLKEHGHRALMEFDLCTKPWIMAPELLMEALQNMRDTKQSVFSSRTDKELLASLVTPKKGSTRKVLGWILPLCRRMVVYRECTKASLVLGLHKVRLALLSLGRLLVRRWYLPHQDLVFYFRVHELSDYIRTRDPVLLRKAQQRRHYYQSWGKLKFPELNRGWPQPLAQAEPRLASAGTKLQATPVCAGDVVARAAVIKDLSEIGQLRQGDILITQSTDIGWSPYFPLISGIVTELGGLISHGAVIAREYGLPCVVGAAGATDVFQTGDLIRLRGAQGTIEKVQHADNSEESVLANA